MEHLFHPRPDLHAGSQSPPTLTSATMDLENLPGFTFVWIAGALCLTMLEHLGFISEHQLFFSTYYVFQKHQYWRIVTSFMYFGKMGLMFAVRILELVTFASYLEAQTFGPTRRPQYAWFLLCTSLSLLVVGSFFSIRFMSYPLSWIVIYVWSRKNRHMRISFLGIVTITAPYYPFFELLFKLIQSNVEFKDIVAGLVLGHLYYFLEELWPREMPSYGYHWIGPPQRWCVLHDADRSRLELFEAPAAQ